MGPLQANADTGWDGSSTGLAEGPRRLRFTRPPEDLETAGRHEPQSLIEGIVPKDPYAAWLEQREAERELERESSPQIRWVHRPRGEAGTAIVARRL